MAALGGHEACLAGGTRVAQHWPDDTALLEDEQATAFYPEGEHSQMFKSQRTPTSEGPKQTTSLSAEERTPRLKRKVWLPGRGKPAV